MYKTLFSAKFDAHDTLEDVKTLRKILSTAPLQIPKKNTVQSQQIYIAQIYKNKIPSSRKTEYWKFHLTENPFEPP